MSDQLFEYVCNAVREHMSNFFEPHEMTVLDGGIIFMCSIFQETMDESLLSIDVRKDSDESVLALASCVRGLIGPCSDLLLRLRIAGLHLSLSLNNGCLHIRIPNHHKGVKNV